MPPGPELVAAPRPQRVTFALLRILYDALPLDRRLRLAVPGVTWQARANRVESNAIEKGSELYRALYDAVVTTLPGGAVEIPEDARRCRWCGCTEIFACNGGCGWLQVDRCSGCRDVRAEVETHRLTPGALTPGATARKGRR